MNTKYAGKSDDAVKKATGKTWDEWIKILNSKGVADMTHKDIARMLYDGGYIKSGWWAQSVTVGYEQAIGRRVAGQRNEGHFTISASKTLNGTMDDVLDKWENLAKEKKKFNGIGLVGEKRVSSTDKWRYWRADFTDKSKLNVRIGAKNDEVATLTVDHFEIVNQKSADTWREYWKTFLKDL